MASRERVIAQKRTTLTDEMMDLATLMNSSEKINYDDVHLRFERIRTLFNAYEDMHDELVVSDLDVPGQEQMKDLKKLFFKLSAAHANMQRRFEQQQGINKTNESNALMGHSTFIERQKQLKLPIASLPKFGGEVERWWFFRRNFESMVNSRTDIDEVVKFHYLQGCLEGEAANKLTMLEPSSENYNKAWKVLTDAYERKRVLLYKHLDMLFDIAPYKQVTHESLNKMIDSTRQNIHMLELEGCKIPDIVIVRTLEKLLPSEIRTKWEETLGRDEIPTFKKFDDFVVDTALRMQTISADTRKRTSNEHNKQSGEHGHQNFKPKNRKVQPRSLATSTVFVCPHCQRDHPLFKGPEFGNLNVQQRWDFVRSKGLCRNCLQIHGNQQCPSNRRCKQCNKFHHSLLHSGNSNNSNSGTTPAPNNKAEPRTSN